VRNTGCRFVNVTVPEPDFEPEFELEFNRKDKANYRWYLALVEEYKGLENLPKAAAKPRTKKKKLGEAQQTRSKAKRTRSSR